MARATVFVDERGEPCDLTDEQMEAFRIALDSEGHLNFSDVLPPGISIDQDCRIVSEWSLRVSVRALQHIYNTSACPGSRAAADLALRGVALGGDLEVTPDNKPAPIKLEDHERPDKIDPSGNVLKLWGE